MELSKLQRLGISSLLLNYRYHGNLWFHSGTITFKRNDKGEYINMYVKTVRYTQTLVLSFTLEIDENIDCDIKYACAYDYDLDLFRIHTCIDVGGDC